MKFIKILIFVFISSSLFAAEELLEKTMGRYAPEKYQTYQPEVSESAQTTAPVKFAPARSLIRRTPRDTFNDDVKGLERLLPLSAYAGDYAKVQRELEAFEAAEQALAEARLSNADEKTMNQLAARYQGSYFRLDNDRKNLADAIKKFKPKEPHVPSRYQSRYQQYGQFELNPPARRAKQPRALETSDTVSSEPVP